MLIFRRGRPRAWSDESLITMALEWRRRHGRLPRASDWSTVKARSQGGVAQQRLDDPPPGCDRWPPASTVNDAFGNWAAFRDACERGLPLPPGEQVVWAYLHRRYGYNLAIEVIGDTGRVNRAHEQWRMEKPARSAGDGGFIVWAVTNGHALVNDAIPSPSDDHDVLKRQLEDAMRAGRLWLAFLPSAGHDDGAPPADDTSSTSEGAAKPSTQD